jgi:DNA-binding Lrp family transcriptional regulator
VGPPDAFDTGTGPADNPALLGRRRSVFAYILVQTAVGKQGDVSVEIGRLDGVASADPVTGPYDVIVRAEARSLDDLGRKVLTKIEGIEGITRTLTCPIVTF